MERQLSTWVRGSIAVMATAMPATACGGDGDREEGDPRTAATDQAIVGPAPDYVLTQVTDPPAGALNGASFSITTTVRNVGDAAAIASSTTRYFLSIDRAQGGDRRFAQTTTVPPLAVGASDAQTALLTLPRNTPSGTYFIVACADAGAVVAELNNANNCAASAGAVVVTGPDLVVASLSDPPHLAVPGTAFQVTDTVRNEGTAPAGSSAVGYWLSPVPARDPAARRLLPNRAVGTLAVGATSTGTVTLTVPALAIGSYYLVACADVGSVIDESSELDNCAAAAGTLTIPIADLSIAALGDPPAHVEAGDGFPLAEATANSGNLAAPPSETRFALSPDPLPGGDLSLLATRSVPQVEAGASSAGTSRLVVDLATPPGDYFVIACADAGGAVVESAEANNCRSSAGTVSVTAPVPANVTVRLIGRADRSPPGAGVPVLVHGADGGLLATTATQVDATAAVTVPPGGTVTVVEPDAPGIERPLHFLTTFRGLKDGDQVVVGDLDHAMSSFAEPIGTTALTVPFETQDEVAYWLMAGWCAAGVSTSPQMTVSLFDGCSVPSTAAQVFVYSPDGSTFLGSVFDPDIALRPDEPVVMDGTLVPPSPFRIDLTGFPADVLSIDLRVARMSGPTLIDHWYTGDSLPVVDAEAHASFPRSAAGDRLLAQFTFWRWDPPYGEYVIIDDRLTDSPALQGDVSGDLVALPMPSSLLRESQEPGGTQDVVGLSWVMADGPPVDGTVLQFARYESATTGWLVWTVVAPPAATGAAAQIRLPSPPPDLAPLWAFGAMNEVRISTVDTPSRSYREFVRDAEPQHKFQWRGSEQTDIGRVRIARQLIAVFLWGERCGRRRSIPSNQTSASSCSVVRPSCAAHLRISLCISLHRHTEA